MARTKLLFASFGTGVVITTAIFITLLFVRALFKTAAALTVILWLFWWPMHFIGCLPGISNNALIWLSLAVGVLMDIVFISVVTYFALGAIISRQRRARIVIPPPQPPTFDQQS